MVHDYLEMVQTPKPVSRFLEGIHNSKKLQLERAVTLLCICCCAGSIVNMEPLGPAGGELCYQETQTIKPRCVGKHLCVKVGVHRLEFACVSQYVSDPFELQLVCACPLPGHPFV